MFFMEKEKMLSEALSNSIASIACAYALRDVLLTTPELRELFNAKQKEYIKKYVLDFAQSYNVQNPEKLLEQLLSETSLP